MASLSIRQIAAFDTSFTGDGLGNKSYKQKRRSVNDKKLSYITINVLADHEYHEA